MSNPASFLTEEQRQQAIGREGSPVIMEVEKGAIIKFAEAIGDDNPLFNDEAAARQTRHGGLIAPPTFLRSLRVGLPELPFEEIRWRLLYTVGSFHFVVCSHHALATITQETTDDASMRRVLEHLVTFCEGGLSAPSAMEEPAEKPGSKS